MFGEEIDMQDLDTRVIMIIDILTEKEAGVVKLYLGCIDERSHKL